MFKTRDQVMREEERGACAEQEVDRLSEKLRVVTDLIDDILYDPHFKPTNEYGERITGDDFYLLDHPVQEQHLPALRQWFVEQHPDISED